MTDYVKLLANLLQSPSNTPANLCRPTAPEAAFPSLRAHRPAKLFNAHTPLL